jgi:aspartate aminotransferase
MKVKVSATLAINEAIAERRKQGLPVLPMGFGEAGLPVHPLLLIKLHEGARHNGYGSVSGSQELREAVAGYWTRRGLPTVADNIVSGPGSKPLLYGLLLAIGGDVVIPVPCWVSYAAQAQLIGSTPLLVPTLPGQGGIPDPDLLVDAVVKARADGRDIRSVIVTLPDNPTGTVASPKTVRRLCAVAEELDLIIISDEIYRDLVFDPDSRLVSPAEIAPERTIITNGLSKSLALGGWRVGAARFPNSVMGQTILGRLKAIASEIWSSPPAPMQHAAAYAFSEPQELIDRVAMSRRLHAAVANAVAERFRTAGATVAQPQGAFYIYPDLENWREHIEKSYGITTGAGLSAHFLQKHGLGVLPANEFGEAPEVLRFRVATSLIYGDTEAQREEALASEDPTSLPWIKKSLDQLESILAAVAPDKDIRSAKSEEAVLQV